MLLRVMAMVPGLHSATSLSAWRFGNFVNNSLSAYCLASPGCCASCSVDYCGEFLSFFIYCSLPSHGRYSCYCCLGSLCLHFLFECLVARMVVSMVNWLLYFYGLQVAVRRDQVLDSTRHWAR